MEQTEKKLVNQDKRVILYISTTIFLLCTFYGIFLLITSNESSKATLIILEGVVSILAPLVFPIAEKIFKVKIGSAIYIFSILFLFLSVCLGETLNFYERIPLWDKFLHLTSGCLLTFIAYCFISEYLRELDVTRKVKLSIIFSVFFALSLLFCWEIAEYIIDNVFGTNMQKFIPIQFDNGGNSFINLTGSALEIGEWYMTPEGYHFAVKDTMDDIIIGFLGSVLCAYILHKVAYKNVEALDAIVVAKEE